MHVQIERHVEHITLQTYCSTLTRLLWTKLFMLYWNNLDSVVNSPKIVKLYILGNYTVFQQVWVENTCGVGN